MVTPGGESPEQWLYLAGGAALLAAGLCLAFWLWRSSKSGRRPSLISQSMDRKG